MNKWTDVQLMFFFFLLAIVALICGIYLDRQIQRENRAMREEIKIPEVIQVRFPVEYFHCDRVRGEINKGYCTLYYSIPQDARKGD